MGTSVSLDNKKIEEFRKLIWEHGRELYRDLPWRNTRDPYEILVSEVMLQQTQVSRVLDKWPAWLELFPTVDALAAVPLAPVLEAWQGLGYNRRAIALKKCAEECSSTYGGTLPTELKQLIDLPGIGPATAAGVRAFAFGLPGIYLETNVRAVYLHEFFSDADGVTDKELIPLIEATCDPEDPRGWYYALLDYGVYLKKIVPNPSRRSAHHTKQSKFEGSNRQKRAYLLREVMARPGLATEDLAFSLSSSEKDAGRPSVQEKDVRDILNALAADGFIACDQGGHWHVL